jgi:thiol-disulfide isomerase/thioredoxin
MQQEKRLSGMKCKTSKMISTLTVLFGCIVITTTTPAAEPPTAKLALSFLPTHKGLEYETPTTKEYSKCQVKVEKTKAGSGWIVVGPNGQLLRRFVDTNGDNVVDQWRYFNRGIEVYRDIDRNFNNKVDQSRWLNTGGSRWAIDKNEDGKVDFWKVISAEEVSREAIAAIANGNANALKLLLINAADIKSLGINAELSRKLLEAVNSPNSKIAAIRSSSKILNSKTRWLRFDGSTPGTIPSDAGKASTDLLVYENTMAIVDNSGKTGLVQIGELVRVGKVWKMTQIPKPLEGDSVQVSLGGLLMQPDFVSTTSPANPLPTGSVSPEMQKLLEQIQKLDQNSSAPTAGISVLKKFNSDRTALLDQIRNLAKTDVERDQWTRQLVDEIAVTVQTGTYPDGLKKLQSLESEIKKSSPKSALLAYVSYRRLIADYSTQLHASTSSDKREKVQTWWLEQLQKFTKEFSGSAEASEAMLQLAISEEFSGKLADARKWYDQLVADHSQTRAGVRATGAMRRLELKGKTFKFSGPGLNGGTIDVGSYGEKTLLVLFWATWCKPCTEDLPQIRALYATYHDRGFEILGVNLDLSAEPVTGYLKQHRVTWPQIHQPGGLESKPAEEFGIISLPTMFLVDSNGKVVSRNVSIDDLKTMVPEQIKKKPGIGSQ